MPSKTDKSNVTVIKKKKSKVATPKGAVKLDRNRENELRNNVVPGNTVQAFFLDRPLFPPYGFLVGQLRRQLIVGGRIYVTSEVDAQLRNVLETYYGEGYSRDELVVYGGESEIAVEEKPEEPEEAAEDTSG